MKKQLRMSITFPSSFELLLLLDLLQFLLSVFVGRLPPLGTSGRNRFERDQKEGESGEDEGGAHDLAFFAPLEDLFAKGS